MDLLFTQPGRRHALDQVPDDAGVVLNGVDLAPHNVNFAFDALLAFQQSSQGLELFEGQSRLDRLKVGAVLHGGPQGGGDHLSGIVPPSGGRLGAEHIWPLCSQSLHHHLCRLGGKSGRVEGGLHQRRAIEETVRKVGGQRLIDVADGELLGRRRQAALHLRPRRLADGVQRRATLQAVFAKAAGHYGDQARRTDRRHDARLHRRAGMAKGQPDAAARDCRRLVERFFQKSHRALRNRYARYSEVCSRSPTTRVNPLTS